MTRPPRMPRHHRWTVRPRRSRPYGVRRAVTRAPRPAAAPDGVRTVGPRRSRATRRRPAAIAQVFALVNPMPIGRSPTPVRTVRRAARWWPTTSRRRSRARRRAGRSGKVPFPVATRTRPGRRRPVARTARSGGLPGPPAPPRRPRPTTRRALARWFGATPPGRPRTARSIGRGRAVPAARRAPARQPARRALDQPTTAFKRCGRRPERAARSPSGSRCTSPRSAERTTRSCRCAEPRAARPRPAAVGSRREPDAAPAEARTALPRVGADQAAAAAARGPAAPLDLLAELTNTPPPPETPMRTAVRRVKIWTPLVLLLLIVFCVVQAVRPLPATALELGTASLVHLRRRQARHCRGPTEGQSAVEVEGVGTLGTVRRAEAGADRQCHQGDDGLRRPQGPPAQGGPDGSEHHGRRARPATEAGRRGRVAGAGHRKAADSSPSSQMLSCC